MNFFVRNVLLLHIVALVLAFSWIHGGTRTSLLLPVIPWLAAFTLEFLLVFPQAKKVETLSEARARVWGALARDPLTYAAIALTVLLSIPLFNEAGAPAYNAVLKQWTLPKPPIPWLPSCVSVREQTAVLLWFAPVLIAALAARHGLLKRGKRILLETLCWNGAALVLLGIAQQMGGAKAIYWGKETLQNHFFSTFGYQNLAGAFFTLLFGISVGLWFSKAASQVIASEVGGGEPASWLEKHYLLLAVALNLTGAVASVSRAAIVLCVLLTVFLGLYMAVGVWQKLETAGKIKVLAAVGAGLVLTAISIRVFAPKELMTEVRTITPQAITERVLGRAYYHVRVAYDVVRDHPAFGVGCWGYRHYVPYYLPQSEHRQIQMVGGANVHNDSIQFLAEHGVVGFGLMLLCAFMVLVPLLGQAWRYCSKSAVGWAEDARVLPKPVWLYRIPSPVVGVLAATTATVCHSFGDLPFRSPAVMSCWFLALVCAVGFIPAARR